VAAQTLEDLGVYLFSQMEQQLMGGGDFPLPSNQLVHWLSPGMPFPTNFFDFAINGPYANPSGLTLDDFAIEVERLTKLYASGSPAAAPDRDKIIAEARAAYLDRLLSNWEEWSNLVNFVPLMPSEKIMGWRKANSPTEAGRTSVAYGQAGVKLSSVYKDSLTMCEVADMPLTAEQAALIEKSKAFLMVEEEIDDPKDFLSPSPRKIKVQKESAVMERYREYLSKFDDAVCDYSTAWAASQTGDLAAKIIWNRSGGLKKRAALRALADWESFGMKQQVEQAQSMIAHITGSSMVAYTQNLLRNLKLIEESTAGQTGDIFYPATLIPSAFARSDGWTTFNRRSIHSTYQQNQSSSSWGASGKYSGFFGLIRANAGASGSSSTKTVAYQGSEFGIEFKFTQVQIVRPWFEPTFYKSRGWRPNAMWSLNYSKQISDGKPSPDGEMIGFATKALFIKDLTIYSKELAIALRAEMSNIQAGGGFSWGPFSLGGSYATSKESFESSISTDNTSITVRGMQLIGFVSSLLPKSASPSPDVSKWV
jgi:hypothetical protein